MFGCLLYARGHTIMNGLLLEMYVYTIIKYTIGCNDQVNHNRPIVKIGFRMEFILIIKDVVCLKIKEKIKK